MSTREKNRFYFHSIIYNNNNDEKIRSEIVWFYNRDRIKSQKKWHFVPTTFALIKGAPVQRISYISYSTDKKKFLLISSLGYSLKKCLHFISLHDFCICNKCRSYETLSTMHRLSILLISCREIGFTMY